MLEKTFLPDESSQVQVLKFPSHCFNICFYTFIPCKRVKKSFDFVLETCEKRQETATCERFYNGIQEVGREEALKNALVTL